MFIERLLGADFLLREFLGLRPLAVIEIDLPPAIGDRFVADLGIGRVPIDRTVEEALRLPRGTGHDLVAQLQAEAAIADAAAVFQAGLGIRVVLGHHGDGHRVFRQDVHTDDIVRSKLDGIDGHEFTVDIQHEPIVRIDVQLDGVGHGRFHEAGRTTLPAFFLGRLFLAEPWLDQEQAGHGADQHRDEFGFHAVNQAPAHDRPRQLFITVL